jgi:hypothetical protein
VLRDELARTAPIDAVQLTQSDPASAGIGRQLCGHDRGMAVRRELGGRIRNHGSDAAAKDLWNEAEGSYAVIELREECGQDGSEPTIPTATTIAVASVISMDVPRP